MDRRRGFSLIELVIVIAILGIIAAIGAKVLQTGFTNYFNNANITQADQEARLAVEFITRDIHAIPYPTAITTATATQLVFTNINGNSITYQLSSTNLMRNSQILAAGISALNFTYWDKNLATTTTPANICFVTVTFTMTQGNVAYTFRDTVSPLNY